MNLYLIQRYSEGALMLNADISSWNNVDEEVTIHYEPGEEADVYMGTCLMMGYPVRFVKIVNRHFELEHGERCYVLAKHEPTVERLAYCARKVRLQYTSIFERTHETKYSTLPR
jgi:hypothetical protein